MNHESCASFVDEEELDVVNLRLSDVDGNRADNINPLLEDSVCWLDWPDEPWTLRYYISTRGQDNGHIYFWIMKDLAWLQCWFYTGHIFGSLALLWSFFMMIKSYCYARYEDAFVVLCQSIWLFGNFWWMNGELYDEKYPNRESIYDDRARQSGYMLLTAFCMISTYYFIVFPLRELSPLFRSDLEDATNGNGNQKRKETYDPVNRVYDRLQSINMHSGMKAHTHLPSMVFKSWKHYENIHILMWLGKDTAWNWSWQVMWVVFSIPTILVGLDFIHKSLLTKRLMIDHAHYCSQFLWVFSNLIWAYGELFLPEERDTPIDFWTISSDAKKSARWYATWILLSAFVPLIVLYIIWIYGTLIGKISTPIELRRNANRNVDALEPMLISPDS